MDQQARSSNDSPGSAASSSSPETTMPCQGLAEAVACQPEKTLVFQRLSLLTWGIACGGFICASLGMLWASYLVVFVGCALLAVASLWLLYCGNMQQEMLSSNIVRLDKAYLELKEAYDRLGNYLAEVDRRTSCYFHCETNSHILCYRRLRLMEAGLAELIERLFAHLDVGTWGNVLAAYELLQSGWEMEGDAETLAVRNAAQVPQFIERRLREFDRLLQELDLDIQGWRRYAPEELKQPGKGAA